MTHYALVAILSLALVASASAQQTFRVHVTVPEKDGFLDASRSAIDSANDLKKKLSAMSTFTVVDALSAADLVVRVVARGQGAEEYGRYLSVNQTVFGLSAASLPLTSHDFWVQAVIEVGDYRKPLASRYSHTLGSASMGAWTECAGQLATDIKAWVEANAARLRRHRGAAATPAPVQRLIAPERALYELSLSKRSKRWKCAATGRRWCRASGCADLENDLRLEIDFDEMTYGRCDSKECDTRKMNEIVTGIYTTLVLPMSGSISLTFKAANDGSEFNETAVVGASVFTTFGVCMPAT